MTCYSLHGFQCDCIFTEIIAQLRWQVNHLFLKAFLCALKGYILAYLYFTADTSDVTTDDDDCEVEVEEESTKVFCV